MRFLLKPFIVLCLALWLTACATGPKLVVHTFSFSGWFDKWAEQVDLLEYSYGDQYHMVRRKAKPDEQTLGYSAGVSGAMPVGDFLHVKWRIKDTGEVFEDKVDLRKSLPANMFEHEVTFVIDGKQLYVYLVTPKAKRQTDQPLLKTTASRYRVTYEIYPHNTYKP
ncbi:MAG: hypothetical protein EOO23_04690 [Comamonadaceae bacterium]|nr:MAG: hypothetical protein EOO23_04690 [Comamonadaceae bacterium]